MAYPLFDANFTLWAADLDARLLDQFGRSARTLGIALRVLQERFYRGESAAEAFSHIAGDLAGGR